MPIRNVARSVALRNGVSDAEVYACVAAILALAALPLVGAVALLIWGA